MGAGNGKDADRYGHIFLQTDKVSYTAGETVTGRIYLNMFLPYQGNQLSLKLKGKEVAHILEQTSMTREVERNGQVQMETYYVDTEYNDKHNVIKMVVPVHQWANFMPGQYTIPFAFMLPANIPGSFHQRGHRYLADINYHLEAIMEPFDRKHTPRLKFRQNFVVKEPIKSIVHGASSEITTNVSACCSGKGTNVLRVQFEKNYYTPGEIAQVIMQLDNTKCQINNTALAFTLKQNLTINAAGRTISRNLVKVQRSLPGIPSGQASSQSFMALNLPPFRGEEYKKIKFYNLPTFLLEGQENNEIMTCSTNGKHVKSEYYLEASCPMEGCCATTPTISLPLQIYFPEFQPVVAQTPQNWNPQVFDCVNVAFQPGAMLSVGIPNQISMNMNTGMNQNAMIQDQGMNVKMNVDMNQQYNQQGGMNLTVTETSQNQNVQYTDNYYN
jgi:hypothetical protein